MPSLPCGIGGQVGAGYWGDSYCSWPSPTTRNCNCQVGDELFQSRSVEVIRNELVRLETWLQLYADLLLTRSAWELVRERYIPLLLRYGAILTVCSLLIH
jgi:hypothetical protein